MNTRMLRNFVVIADVGSFTGAAAALSIAQPALTRQVRELEQEFGAELLQRRPRGVVLTPAGGTFYEAARRIITEETRLRDAMARNRNGGPTSVVIGSSPSLAGVLLPSLLENCANTLRGISVTSREAFTPVLLDMVERGTVDVAVVTNPEGRHSLSYRPVLSEPFALFSNRDFGIGRLVTLDDLADLPLLMTSLHLRIVRKQLISLGRNLSVTWEIDSVEAIRDMISNRRFATIMPISVFKDGPGSEKLTTSEISGVQLNRQLALATRIDPRPTSACSLLEELIESEFERLSAEGRFSFSS